MGQVLHGSAPTTHAVRAAIKRSKAAIAELSARYGLNPKTVAKWRKRDAVADAPMGPKETRSSVLSPGEEAMAVAFRKHTLLPLDDCLYALQASIPHLSRSSLHRCFQRHGISRLPEVEGTKPRKAFKDYPLGFFHIDIAEVRTGEGKLHLFVAIDRTSKFAFAELHEKAPRRVAADFLRRLIAAVPYRIHTILTDTARTSPILARAARRSRRSSQRSRPARSSAPTPSSWPAHAPASSTGLPGRTIPGPMVRSSA